MIYLDYNATTPVLPEVMEAMQPYFVNEWGNPSSSYKFGSKLKTVIENAREQVANLIGAHPMEVIFTSCATESNNAAIHAALKAHPAKRHIVTSAVEHSSVLNYCMALDGLSTTTTFLVPLGNGDLKSNRVLALDLSTPIKRPLEYKPSRFRNWLYFLQIANTSFADNSEIECPQQMRFARAILSANENAATFIKGAEIEGMFAEVWPEVLERQRINVDFSHFPCSLLRAPSRP